MSPKRKNRIFFLCLLMIWLGELWGDVAAPCPETRLYDSGGVSDVDSWGKEASPANFIGEELWKKPCAWRGTEEVEDTPCRSKTEPIAAELVGGREVIWLLTAEARRETNFLELG
jgi:hypothetical protein